MDGLDALGTHEDESFLGGFDYMSLVKGAGNLLSGVAEGFGDKGGGGGAAAAAEKAKADEARRKAEASASTMKMALIGVLALVGLGGVVFLARRK